VIIKESILISKALISFSDLQFAPQKTRNLYLVHSLRFLSSHQNAD